MDEFFKKHRQEQRDLQSRITQKKKNASKKTRKGINDECAELERQLMERHEREVAQLTPGTRSLEDYQDVPQDEEINDLPPDVQTTATDMRETNFSDASKKQEQPKKPNRQKARLARRTAEQEEIAAQAIEEASGIPDRRAEEKVVMERESKSRGLVEQEVRSDGHCLYAAVADQLKQGEIDLELNGMPDYRAVRRDAANFIEQHPDDFAPFLEEPLDAYVVKVRDTAEWGGQLEISALARAYGITVYVLQGDGRIVAIEPGTGSTAKSIWLAYHRHFFGLGEHYNSLRRIS